MSQNAYHDGATSSDEMSKHRHYDDHDAGPEWGTPRHVWEPLAETLDGFDLDPASGAEPEPIAAERYTVEDDGLAQPWFGDVWVNPPYGREFNPAWAEKIHTEAGHESVETITALVPASTDTQYFQNNYAYADYFTFIEGRLEFIGAGDSKASFASVLVTYGDVPDAYLEVCDELGFVVTRI